MPTKEQIQAANPDWTEEQVTAELDRLKAELDKDPKPKPDEGKDRAMAELRRRAEAAEKTARDAKAELDRIEREKAEKAGEWEKLAKQYETERDEARLELAGERQNATVEKAAGRLKFRNTDEAVALLPTDLDRADTTAVDKALEQLAVNRPHLIDTGKTVQSGLPPGPRSTDLTLDQIKQMTPKEYLARKDEVDKAVTQLS